MFSDSCNFVHAVKSPVAPELRLPNVGRSLSYPNDEHEHDTKHDDHPLFDLENTNKSGIWGAARRQSWASIHSIASADSNLSFPTDRSPTASRTSSPTNDDEVSRHVTFENGDTDAVSYYDVLSELGLRCPAVTTQGRTAAQRPTFPDS